MDASKQSSWAFLFAQSESRSAMTQLACLVFGSRRLRRRWKSISTTTTTTTTSSAPRAPSASLAIVTSKASRQAARLASKEAWRGNYFARSSHGHRLISILFLLFPPFPLFPPANQTNNHLKQERLLLSILPKHLASEIRQDLGAVVTGQFKKIYMSRHENVR